MKKKWKITIILSAVVIAGILGVVIWKMNDTSPPEPTPPVVNTPTSVPTDSPTPAPTDSPTPLPTPTLSPPPVPTDTPTPEPTPTEELTPTEGPSPTEEPLPTDSPTPEPTDSPTPEPTNTATPVPTKEPTKTPTNTVTPKPTKAPTPTFTPTPVPTPTEAPLLANPITMWIAVDDFCVYDKDVYMSTDPHKMQKIDNQGKKRGDTVVVIRRNVNFATSEQSYIDEIQWNGGTALVRENHLSMTHVEPIWAEPRERKDIADALMAMVQNYRVQNGIRKLESPYVYYPVNYEGNYGDYLKNKAVRVAKKCCMEGTANHEGGQIGTGIYGNTAQSPREANACATILFNNWKNSPAHNANLLYDHSSLGDVDVGLMTVVEWYNGSGYQYCAIMTLLPVEGALLPEGLQ